MVVVVSNSTIVHFSDVQKGFLPVVAVPCLILSLLVYKFAKRPMRYDETMVKRMEYFYSAIAAALLGHIIFGIMPNMKQPYPVCIGIGFFFMKCIQDLSSTWKENEFISTDEQIHDLLDGDTMHIKSIRVEDDLSDDNIALNRARTRLQVNEVKKRRIIALVLLSCMFLIAPIDGLYLSEHGMNRTVMVVMFWISKLIQTMVISVCMLHAFFHWYLIFSILWAIVCALSPLSAILNFEGIVEDMPAVMVFYATSTGVLLLIALYFISVDGKKSSTKKTIVKLFIFASVFLGVWITSFFI